VPDRLRERGTRRPTSTKHPGSLAKLLDLAQRDEEEGLGDAPWPPHFRKQKDEPKRVQPSRDPRFARSRAASATRSRPAAADACRPSRTQVQDRPRRQSGERTGQGYDEEFEDA